MPHPVLGLPPSDVTAGNPAAAARLRASSARLAQLALEETFSLDHTFDERYDELSLRTFLRDYDRHIEQLARAMETGEQRFVVQYAEWLVPVFRHRRVPMHDFRTLLAGLLNACDTVLSRDDAALARALIQRWGQRLQFHQRLAGDHAGNKLVRFFWKGAGLADDKTI